MLSASWRIIQHLQRRDPACPWPGKRAFGLVPLLKDQRVQDDGNTWQLLKE